MKKHLLLLGFLVSLFSCSENPKSKKADQRHTVYSLHAPFNWETEEFPIPISFAKDIPYTGKEQLRFAPGWSKKNTNEYWSYIFLWSLNNKPVITADTIQNYLQLYYTGLINSNVSKRNLQKEKITETVVSVKKAVTGKGDAATFTGTVSMYDYMAQEPIILNCIVHIKSCAQQNNLFIVHELSPKPFTDTVWKSLNEIDAGFECGN